VLLCHSMRAELDKGESQNTLSAETSLLTYSVRRHG
jgi:hypothetical protein